MPKALMTIAASLGVFAVIMLAAEMNAAARVFVVMGLFAFGIGFGWWLTEDDCPSAA